MIFHQARPSTIAFLLSVSLLTGCNDVSWNSPYSEAEQDDNTLFTSFEIRPKHLDPAQSYSSNEVIFTGQIYEPPLQYHYLKRPYTLIPLSVTEVPVPRYEDRDGNPLPASAEPSEIAFSTYTMTVQPGIRYQPHPAFARYDSGKPVYQDLSASDMEEFETLADFKLQGSRELIAADYVYQIKRLAHPKLHSPIFGLMSEYIVGLREYAQILQQATPDANGYLDLQKYSLAGVEVVDRYTYTIRLKGVYPQFIYWLAMPFFAPIAPEVDHFYSQPGMAEKNITLDWYPVGTGPYMLTVNNPNRQMVMERNPNYHGESYPSEGDPEDEANGLLTDAGRPLPFIDRVVFSLERENIPTWNKFLQGFYDASGVSSDSFDQAIQVSGQGEVGLTDEMRAKNIQLVTSITASTYYMGFNMRDSVLGGYSEKAQKLRQAISIAIDYEEFISIFLNGRGVPAQGPLPPGIFGHLPGERGFNPYVYDWVDGKLQRKPITEAKRLLAEAGYPDGRDADTGKPLIVHLDTTGGGPDDKARFDWLRKQFLKLDLQLDIRSTDYNRFQDKMLKGTAQIFQWGWNADYPDPENFLFLLYGPNAKAEKNGENAANYENAEFDRLFLIMKDMPNGDERQAILTRMTNIVRKDSPWLWGLHPKSFSLFHSWLHNIKVNQMANNTLKYRRIDPQLRHELRASWNHPVVWPLVVLVIISITILLPAVITYRRKLRALGVMPRRTG